jgi:dihydrofolate reductase
MRKLIYGMNVTLDGYIAAPGDDIGWSGPPSNELFQWWLDQERASGLSLYGRKLWETMSSYWPTGDQQPNATPAEIEFARSWRDTPKGRVTDDRLTAAADVFSSAVGQI